LVTGKRNETKMGGRVLEMKMNVNIYVIYMEGRLNCESEFTLGIPTYISIVTMWWAAGG